ncbi:MAG: NAD-dependent epimerase/dehydratase family protein [Verrucomicrobia bacterium]|nr:NAD-dependent epimerase/dehydratase family protein [Verrucomicrobiota bacterium]
MTLQDAGSTLRFLGVGISMERKLALITGATGFVGRHLCPKLEKAGYALRAVYIEPEPPKGWPENMEWIKLDHIGPDTNWNPALRGGVTHVVHLAAIAHRIAPKDQVADASYDEVNHLGTAELARAAALTPSVRRFFFMSSIGAVTSLSDQVVNEQTPCHPDTAYGRSKLAAENAIQEILRKGQVGWCIFRPPLLYGPANPGNMERLLKLLKLPLPLPLGSIRNRRAFLYVGNLVDAICVALEHPAAARQVFCISDGEELSTTDLLRRLSRVSRRSVRLFPFPMSGLRVLGTLGEWLRTITGRSMGLDRQVVEKLCGSLSVDSSFFRQTCGWTPPFTVEEGLMRTVTNMP